MSHLPWRENILPLGLCLLQTISAREGVEEKVAVDTRCGTIVHLNVQIPEFRMGWQRSQGGQRRWLQLSPTKALDVFISLNLELPFCLQQTFFWRAVLGASVREVPLEGCGERWLCQFCTGQLWLSLLCHWHLWQCPQCPWLPFTCPSVTSSTFRTSG